MLDLKETWENLLMWLLCLCTSLLQEIFALYGLWVAIHCFENKNVVKLHAYLGKKSVLLSEVVVLSSTFVFSMKAYIYSVTAQSRKPRSKRSSYVFLVNFCDLHKKNQVCMGWPTPSWFGERYIFFVLSRAWDKEKIQSHYKESNLRPSDSVLRCSNQWATETPLWARSIMTCILHTARIGNVESVMFVERIRRYGKFWAQ